MESRAKIKVSGGAWLEGEGSERQREREKELGEDMRGDLIRVSAIRTKKGEGEDPGQTSGRWKVAARVNGTKNHANLLSLAKAFPL